MSGIDFYCGINETAWNHHPVNTGPLACVSPVYGRSEATYRENNVRVPADAAVIEDSGAFADGPSRRLSFAAALTRQHAHAAKYGYADQVRRLASYDLLIDEKWQDGTRRKERWSESEAAAAVDETVNAARFMAAHRNGTALILSAQGVSPVQYLDCTRRVTPLLRDDDWLGLGGWCIIGKMPAVMMPVFRDTIWRIVPFAAGAGVHHIHIWGVCYAPALGELLWLCDQYGINLSTDSAGPQIRPARGMWGYMGWHNPDYKRPPIETRGLERARHVQATREWLATFDKTKYYHEPERPTAKPYQMTLF